MKWIVHDGSGKLRVEGDAGITHSRILKPTQLSEDWVTHITSQKGVHELLFDPAEGHFSPRFLGLLATTRVKRGEIVWCDPFRLVYPPALEMVGLNQVTIVQPTSKDVVWAVAECLACPGVGAVVGSVPAKMTRVEVRRIQLAAERGGGIGVLLRPWDKGAEIYAATTRWRVSPAPPRAGGTQAWTVKMIHGQGRLDQGFFVERCRAVPAGFSQQDVSVYSSAPLADRPEVAARIKLVG